VTTIASPVQQALTLPGARMMRGKLQIRLPVAWRMRPSAKVFPASEQGATDAIAWYHEHKRLHELGAPASSTDTAWLTLAEVAASFREKRVLKGTRKGKPMRPLTVESLDRGLVPWLTGEFSGLPVKALNAAELELWLLRRAKKRATAARNERGQLMGVLRHAQRLGVDVSPQLLAIDPIPKPQSKPLRALDIEEVPLVLEAAPAFAHDHLLLMVTSGLRIGESFQAVDDWLEVVDRPDGTRIGILHIPATAAKEDAAKDVVLEPDEYRVLARQLLARPAGCPYLFPSDEGGRWVYWRFFERVWKPVRKGAAALARELGVGDPAKLATLRPHELRCTAATYMVRAGLERSAILARLGHHDEGQLLDARYTDTPVEQQVKALEALGVGLLAAQSGRAANGPTDRPPLSPSAAPPRVANVVPLNLAKGTQ